MKLIKEWAPLVIVLAVLGYGYYQLEKFKSDAKEVKDDVITIIEDVIGNPAPEPIGKAPEVQETEPVLVPGRVIYKHTADWCGACQGEDEFLQAWRDIGYNIITVDHTDVQQNPSPYGLPWYEIKDNGARRIWVGSIKNYRR